MSSPAETDLPAISPQQIEWIFCPPASTMLTLAAKHKAKNFKFDAGGRE